MGWDHVARDSCRPRARRHLALAADFKKIETCIELEIYGACTLSSLFMVLTLSQLFRKFDFRKSFFLQF